MSAQAHASEYNASQSVTSISANARVDYILRFSKHAVLVVDQDANVYSQVASQFLGSLANEHNAAFIAISPKLNDIQIRCRIIEQLFSDTLFDPEQSLAVSLINLAKQEKQAIDIVIEHAQFLSVQILHELCQLTDIAKKANYAISVLMLGTPQAGMILANNKSLFLKKISVLSGQTGQLLTLNAKEFRGRRSLLKLTRFTKWGLAFISFVICLGLLGFWLFQQDVLSLKTKNNLQKVTANSTNLISAYSQKVPNSSAESEDIFLSLTAQQEQVQAIIPNVPAEPADIVNAIASFEQTSTGLTVSKQIKQPKRFESFLDTKPLISNEVALTLESTQMTLAVEKNDVVDNNAEQEDTIPAMASEESSIISTNVNISTIESIDTNESYYKNLHSGFVIQISGFTRFSVYQKFVDSYEGINTKSYYRLFNQQAMLTITSEVFPTHLAAEQAVNLLPSAIKSNRPWIKSIEAINNEINAYQRSQ